ncbi:hypothetical protein FRX31_004483 [Thalictrum thalictroides]|uniref:Uncharacterized protein n=1 Tax=Thalictrum thalictroides TaxID=46969 RepID=A0A7J6XAR1_THATH|nr:hypothetical protein FRX31_004483 [Thalictrum thalictroides]
MEGRWTGTLADSRCYELVEGKSIEVEIWKNSKTWEKVGFTERSGGRVFRCNTFLEGGLWLSKLLCQVSLGTTRVGVVFKFSDGNQFVVATMFQNRRGVVLQFILVNRN